MKTELLDYELPEERIAQHPPAARDGARLLVVDGEQLQHAWVHDWPELVPPGSLVVLNDTRVIKARLFVEREGTGGRAEFLLLQRAPSRSLSQGEVWLALGKGNKPLREGAVYRVGEARLTIVNKTEDRVLELAIEYSAGVAALLEQHGAVPLPPYLKREAQPVDTERYQTTFAREEGSVAAPTAGLHVTLDMLHALRQRNVEIGYTTLHVGAGTFLPVTVADLDQHVMHSETMTVGTELVSQVKAARARQGKVIAVGTTVVRALESAAQESASGIAPFSGATSLLIQPGFRFRVVDSLLTNFHAPRSTLLALVSAFIGTERVQRAYAEALLRDYRFLSYGDAMWLPTRAIVAEAA